jgi:hypothetical protein
LWLRSHFARACDLHALGVACLQLFVACLLVFASGGDLPLARLTRSGAYLGGTYSVIMASLPVASIEYHGVILSVKHFFTKNLVNFQKMPANPHKYWKKIFSGG